MYSIYLLAVLFAVYLLQTVLPISFTQLFWFDPTHVLTQPWGFVTSIFLHGSWLHLLFNSFALMMFGPFLERAIGSRRFLKLFFAAGIAGSVSYYAVFLLGIGTGSPALGASGAIYGILGALAILAPNMMVLIMFVPMQMRYAAIVWVIIEFFGTLTPGTGIASAAHLGGLFLGFAYAKFVLLKRQ